MTTVNTPEHIQELIHHLPDEQKAQLVEELVDSAIVKTTFSGPLPPPKDFAEYEKVLPGAAERILSMPEREQEIRAESQKKILSNDSKRINIAGLLGVALIVVAGIATWNGWALIAIPLGLAGVISAILRHFFGWLDSRTKPPAQNLK